MITYLPHRRKAFQPSGGGFPTDQLVSFWPLNESSGNALDTHGSNDLTDNNTVGSKTSDGPDGDATVRAFTAASSEFFNRADDGTFDAGTSDFTWSIWVRLPTGVANNSIHPIITKRLNGNPVNAGYEFALTAKVTAGRYDVSTSASSISDSSNERAFTTSAIAGTSINQWIHLIFSVDRTADTMALYVDNALHESVDISAVTGSLDNDQAFDLGERLSTFSGMDATHAGFWTKALDSGERTTLYNGGSLLAP